MLLTTRNICTQFGVVKEIHGYVIKVRWRSAASVHLCRKNVGMAPIARGRVLQPSTNLKLHKHRSNTQRKLHLANLQLP